MKKVSDLKPGDSLYFNVEDGISSIKVISIRNGRNDKKDGTGIYAHSGSYERFCTYDSDDTKGVYTYDNGYSNRETTVKISFYTTQAECLQFRKSDLMVKLNELKAQAMDAIRKVHRFRAKNYKLLNEYCTDRHIQKLLRKGI